MIRPIAAIIALVAAASLIPASPTATSISSPDPAVSQVFLPVIMANPTPNTAFSWTDDFSSESSGWVIGDIGTAKWSYQSGEYEMLLRNPGWKMQAIAPIPGLSNYTFTADMRRYSGVSWNYGLVFNHLSDNWFYLFQVDPGAGKFSLCRYDYGTWTELLTWTTSSAINQGAMSNRLGIVRVEGNIEAYINGSLIATGSSSTTATNVGIGFWAESGSTSPASNRYDNFAVNGTRTIALGSQISGSLSVTQTAPTAGTPSRVEVWTAR